MDYNFTELIKQVDAFAKEKLKESRYEHSHRVADYAKYLADLYISEKVDPEVAFFSGLSHDICKNFTDEELLETVKADGLGIDDTEQKRLNLLHGRAAAVILKEKFSVENDSILKAVAFHTFGYENIDALGKIVYIADKIEPRRPNTEEFRQFALKASLNELMMKVLDWNIAFIEKNRGPIHPLTKKMYAGLKLELETETKDAVNEN